MFYKQTVRHYIPFLQTFALAGVMAPTSFHVHVRRNGQFFGLFSFVENIDNTFLKVWGKGNEALGNTAG